MVKKTFFILFILASVLILPVHTHAGVEQINGVIDSVITNKKVIALTFDADMTPKMQMDLRMGKVKSWYNEKIIKILNDEKTPATLFLTGLWIKTYPKITAKLSQNSLLELANHSYSHGGFTKNCFGLNTIPDNLHETEIIKTDKLLSRYAKSYQKYFRFPGLCYKQSDVTMVNKLDYVIIGGNISGDAFEKNPQKIINKIVSNAKPGGIIVLHMHGNRNAPATDKALPQIIHELQKQGYKFVKISELLQTGTPAQ